MASVDHVIERLRCALRSVKAERFQLEAERESETEEFYFQIDTIRKRLDTNNLIPHVYVEHLERDLDPSIPRLIVSSQATLCSLLHRIDAEMKLLRKAKKQSGSNIRQVGQVLRQLKRERSRVEADLNTRLASLQQEVDTLRWQNENLIRKQQFVIGVLRERVGIQETESLEVTDDASSDQDMEANSTATDQSPLDVEAEFNTSLSRHLERMACWLTPRTNNTSDAELDKQFKYASISKNKNKQTNHTLTARGA